jgi:hypothetical protein
MDDLKNYNKQEFENLIKYSTTNLQKQFEMSPEHSRILQRHFEDLKAKGIVEDSETFWFIPAFIVPKAVWREAKDKSDYKL